jgi:single-strand DNA-binding protein
MIQLIVTGNITADAVTRNFENFTVVSFTVASNNRYKSKDGTMKDETTFIRCSLFNRPNAAQLFIKGRTVTVQGTSIKPNSYANGNGDLVCNIDLRVNTFQVFGKREANQNATPEKVEKEFQNSFAEQEQKEAVDDLPF